MLDALCFLATGCGSSDSQFLNGNLPTTTRADRIGSLHLGTPTSQAGVEVIGYDAAGLPAGSTTTDERGSFAVSYTHLTLPTIYSV